MQKFKNDTERAFYDYMLCKGYKESAVWHYITRLRSISPLDMLVTENIDTYIYDYEKGSNMDKNKSSHNAYSSALKRLKDFMTDKGII